MNTKPAIVPNKIPTELFVNVALPIAFGQSFGKSIGQQQCLTYQWPNTTNSTNDAMGSTIDSIVGSAINTPKTPQNISNEIHQEISLGSLVQVPFGKKTIWGIVWSITDKAPPNVTLKTVHQAYPFYFSAPFRQFLQEVSRYTLTPLGKVLPLALPKICYPWLDQKFCPKIQKTTLKEAPKAPKKENLKAIKNAAQEGIQPAGNVQSIAPDVILPDPSNPSSSPLQRATPVAPQLWHFSESNPLTLNQAQTQARNQLNQHLSNNPSKPALLEGVTGSGKSEVLLSLCPPQWRQGKQVLILLPEMALAPQWKKRIQKYYDIPVHIWHSALKSSQRKETFHQCAFNNAPVILGTRSALFLPYPNLGLIIVDEEHDLSYKQGEGLLYHGRDMAILRAHWEKIPLVLSSATPSLETRYHVAHSGFGHMRLNQRYGDASLPEFFLLSPAELDWKNPQWISPSLATKLQETLDKGEQSLVFLNRRGVACLLMCTKCNDRPSCPRCSVWLSVHDKPRRLLCHYCGFWQPIPDICPSCHHDAPLLMVGPGIEGIAKEVQTLFPTARIALLSSDHFSNATMMENILNAITNGEIDILVGTQLVAKGHHFPFMTCIGIVDVDFALGDTDFRARERLFQLVMQVTGRAGRAQNPGTAYIQTHNPKDSFFQHLLIYDWDGFVKKELDSRKAADLPPFSRLSAINFSHKCKFRVEEAALKAARQIPFHNNPAVTVLGPAPAPINPLGNRYRWRILIKTPRDFSTSAHLAHWLQRVALPAGVSLTVDRDPYVFL